MGSPGSNGRFRSFGHGLSRWSSPELEMYPHPLPVSDGSMMCRNSAGRLPASLRLFVAIPRYPGWSRPAICRICRMEALQWLLDCRRPGVLAVMPDLAADGRIEPLLAYYDRACRPLLEEMAATGQRRMNLLRDAEGVITPQPPLLVRLSWRNVNTPQDIDQPPALAQPAAKTEDTTGESSSMRKD